MQIQKKRKRAHLASLVASIAAAMFANSVNAGGFEPIQRLGRHCGFGWGDGYHACKDSGFRPGADLPPRSYHKQFFNARAFGASCAPGSACAATSFYDQFDAAANIRPHGYGAGGCDSGSCDSSGWAAADYTTSRTYVVADHRRSKSGCDSASCDDPACDGVGCDRGAVSYTTAPHSDASQGWTPTPSHSPAMPTSPTQPSYAAPMAPASPTAVTPPADITSSPVTPAPVTPAPATPTRVTPAPVASSAANSPAARSSESDGDSVVSPSDRKLVLPEQGFSEDEPDQLDSSETLPAPASEWIPTPQPDTTPNASDLPQQIENPPIPETLGPLDASIAPNKDLPEGWTEKPVSTNPFTEQESTNRVKLPATLDLIPEATGDQSDDLLLFESAQVNPPPARVAKAIRPSQIVTGTYPDWALTAPADMQLPEKIELPAELNQPVNLGLNEPQSPSSLQSTQKRPTRIPSSLFITQPE